MSELLSSAITVFIALEMLVLFFSPTQTIGEIFAASAEIIF